MTKERKLPKPPAPSAIPKSTRPPTQIELWYLECLRILAAHHKRAPSITELARYCKRSTFPTWSAMLSLESKGLVRRNDARRFEEVKQ